MGVIFTMSPSFKALDGTRTHLVNQLVFFDEQYPFFADTYLYGMPSRDRKMIDDLLQKYTARLISMLAADDTALQDMLYQVVLIGSGVKVEFEEDGSTDLFTVVYPTESDPDNNRISFISRSAGNCFVRNAILPLSWRFRTERSGFMSVK